MYKIYRLFANDSDKEYIGRTERGLIDRLFRHRNENKDNNPILQKWITENRDNLQIELIEETENKNREPFWIKEKFKQGTDLLNIQHHPIREKERREKISKTQKKRYENPEERKKTSEAMKAIQKCVKNQKISKGMKQPLKH